MTIYLIIESSGTYEDYQTNPIKAFKNKINADFFIEQYNRQRKNKLEQEEKCKHCSFYWNHEDVKKEDCIDFIKHAKAFCTMAEFNFDEKSGELYCDCHQSTWELDTYNVRIKEIEVE